MAQLAAHAGAQGRLFLTRDQRMLSAGAGAVFMLASDDPEVQLAQLVRHWNIRCGGGGAWCGKW